MQQPFNAEDYANLSDDDLSISSGSLTSFGDESDLSPSVLQIRDLHLGVGTQQPRSLSQWKPWEVPIKLPENTNPPGEPSEVSTAETGQPNEIVRADSGQPSTLGPPEMPAPVPAADPFDPILAINGLPLQSFDTGTRKVYYVDAWPESGEPSDSILLLHSFPEGPHSLRKLLPLLVARNFRVIAPTLRGYNPEDPKPPQNDAATRNAFYSWRASAADLAGLISHLGFQKMTVAGYNFGSFVACALTLFYPSLVSKLLLISTPYIPPATTYIPPALLAAKADPTLTVRTYLATDKAVEVFDDDPALFFHCYLRPGGHAEYELVAELSRSITVNTDAKSILYSFVHHPSTLLTPKETMLLVHWIDAVGGSGGILQWHRIEANTVAEYQGVPREINVPVLYIGAEFQPLSASGKRADMKRLCSNLTEVILAGGGSWIALERAEEAADIMEEWIKKGELSEELLSAVDAHENSSNLSAHSLGGSATPSSTLSRT